MSSTKQFRDFIIEQLSGLGGVMCRPMMGEYLLYYDNVLFGGIYDDRLLIKKTKSTPNSLTEVIPYKNAKPMYLVENLDDVEYLSELIKATSNDLKTKNLN